MIIALSNTFPVLYRSRFRGEYRTYLIEFAAVRLVFAGISFFFYLAEGFLCRTVKLELEDIYILRSLYYAVHTSVALNLFRINCVNAYKAHYQIKRL